MTRVMKLFLGTILELALVMLGAWICDSIDTEIPDRDARIVLKIIVCVVLFGLMLHIWGAVVGFVKRRDPLSELFGEDACASAPNPTEQNPRADVSAPNPTEQNPAPTPNRNPPVPAEWGRESLARAMEELESGALDKGSWAEALIRADGDEAKAKVEYLKIRGAQHAQAKVQTSSESSEKRSQSEPSKEREETT